MDWFFRHYVSNTTAGMAVQTVFEGTGETVTARAYVRVKDSGESVLLYTGTVDATYADGQRSKAGDVCDTLAVHALRVGMCKDCTMTEAREPASWQSVTFDGADGAVIDGGLTPTDPFMIDTQEGHCLCIEMTFSGVGRLPCHAELQIPSFVKTDDGFVPSPWIPVPVMVGVRRAVAHRVAFFGDSITQGIGAAPGEYRHWAALCAESLGDKAAFWNLGIGFARSEDAARDGGWLYRVKQNDTVVMCLGVNDILRGFSADEIVENIRTTVSRLQQAGCRVLLQAVPPFEYPPAGWRVRQEVNRRICGFADGFFDPSSLLCDGECPRYGGHPNDDGCAVWAQALTPVLAAML